MALTPRQIRQLIEDTVSSVEGLSTLNDSTNPRSSIWNIIKGVFGYLIYYLQNAFLTFTEEVVGTPTRTLSLAWYESVARRFQYSEDTSGLNQYVLNEDEQGLSYNTINRAAQIVSFVTAREVNLAVEDTDPVDLAVEILCAKQVESDREGVFIPARLTEGELNSFKAYMDLLRAVGIKLNAFSRAPDRITFDMVVFVDPTLFKVNGMYTDGEAINSTMRPVEEAINDFFEDLGFTNVFHTSALVDAVQAVNGVVAAEIHGDVQHNIGLDEYTDPNGEDYTLITDDSEGEVGDPRFVNMAFSGVDGSFAGGRLHAGYAVWYPDGSTITYYSAP